MDPPEIEVPSAAQKHAAAVERAAMKLAAGTPPRQAFSCLPRDGITPREHADLMAAATVRSKELIGRNLRRNRVSGIIWTICGVLPLLFFTCYWFRDGTSSWVLLVIGVPSLIKACRHFALKPTAPPDRG